MSGETRWLATIVIAGLLCWASCAETSDASARDDADAGVDAEANDAGAPPPCDAGDPSCHTPTCDEADFCPVDTGTSALHLLTAIWGFGPNDVWAVGSGGTIVRWDGAAWARVPVDGVDTFHAVWGSPAGDRWVAGSSASILHRAAGATTFTPRPVFTPGDEEQLFPGRVLALWGASPTSVRAGGEVFGKFHPDDGFSSGNHVVLTDVDGGTGWRVEEGFDGLFANATVRAIWGATETDVWFAVDDAQASPPARGTLLHGTGTPMRFVSIDSASSAPFEAIWGASASDVWAVGGSGAIRRWTTGAVQWAASPSGTTETLHDVWGSGPNDVWAVGDAGTILHFDGTAWRPRTIALPAGVRPDLHGVWGSGPDDVWCVGDGIALHFTGKKGSSP